MDSAVGQTVAAAPVAEAVEGNAAAAAVAGEEEGSWSPEDSKEGEDSGLRLEVAHSIVAAHGTDLTRRLEEVGRSILT